MMDAQDLEETTMRLISHPLAVPTKAFARGVLALPAAALEIPASHIAASAPCRHHAITSPAVRPTTQRR